jgi:hypothetical protein
MLEAALALATIIRRIEIRSTGDDFPIAVPFTTVAAAPIWARVDTHTNQSTYNQAAPSMKGVDPVDCHRGEPAPLHAEPVLPADQH